MRASAVAVARAMVATPDKVACLINSRMMGPLRPVQIIRNKLTQCCDELKGGRWADRWSDIAAQRFSRKPNRRAGLLARISLRVAALGAPFAGRHRRAVAGRLRDEGRQGLPEHRSGTVTSRRALRRACRYWGLRLIRLLDSGEKRYDRRQVSWESRCNT